MHPKIPSPTFPKDYWECLVHIYDTSITHPEPCAFSLTPHMKEDESRDVSQTNFSIILMITW